MHDLFVIFCAKYLVYVAVALFLAYFFVARRRTKRKMLLLSVISLPLVYIIAKVAGWFYFDPRPFVVGDFTPLIAHVADNGFPSEHTLFASALAAIITLFSPRVGIVLWGMAFLVGLARVFAGVHHFADIAGAVVISTVVVVLVWRSIQEAHWYRG